jgi:glyoxylase-like metal-dependent hydrolase (beta-lactamase superfamily II)
VGDHVLGLTCFPTPGHAYHHVSYLDEEGTLYAGDVCGVRIVPERLVIPPVPPPEIDVEAWDASLDEIERRAPERLALIHFGVVEDDVPGHLQRLRARLHAWEELVERGLSEEEFDQAMRADIEAELGRSADAYLTAAPPGAYQGLKRWVEKIKPSRSRASASA